MKRFAVILALFAVLSVGCSPAGKHPTNEQEPVFTEPQNEVKPIVKQRKDSNKAVWSRTPKQPKPLAEATFSPQAPSKRIARVSVPGKYVALTFDDGPSASVTPEILNILSRHGVRATFFVLGENAARNKGILARAAAEGHEIASHTWSHVNLIKASQEQIISQMDRTAAVVQEVTGRKPALMRPPYGATNKHIIDLMMDRYGNPSVLWDVDTVDWKHPGVSVVIDRAVNQARNGSIILLHDIHASTLQAVEGVVEGLLNRGFHLVTVSQLIRMGKRAAGNETPEHPPAEPAIANTLPPSEEGDERPAPQPQPEPEQPATPPALPSAEPKESVAAAAPEEMSEVPAPQEEKSETTSELEVEQQATTPTEATDEEPTAEL